jgi:hypothetical protein
MTTKITIHNTGLDGEGNTHDVEVAEYNEVQQVFANKENIKPGETLEKYLYEGLVLFVKENPA